MENSAIAEQRLRRGAFFRRNSPRTGAKGKVRRAACFASQELQAFAPLNGGTTRDNPRQPGRQENTMSEHVYKQIELTGSSTQSSDDAIRVALTKASKTLRGIHWFQVTDTRGHVEDGKVAHWQVTIKVGLRIDD